MVLPKPPPAKLSIAWVGNSFVYFNDLPSMLATLLLCAKPFPGTTVEYDSVAPGGQRFAGHADDTAVAGMLRRRAWAEDTPLLKLLFWRRRRRRSWWVVIRRCRPPPRWDPRRRRRKRGEPCVLTALYDYVVRSCCNANE